MTGHDGLGLPRSLGDGLLLRWATAEDTEAVADFNMRMHSDDPDKPQEHLRHWTRDLMSGRHPTTTAGDFTVVLDENKGGAIVSCMNLISQTWTYDGIPFAVGRPELVATLPEYRRRGLVRAQFEAIHALSASRGELVTAITGIPWYYRQFGYEMTVNLGGSRQYFWARSGNDEPVAEELFTWRPATVDDLPLLQDLYRAHCSRSLLTRARDDRSWRYELAEAHPDSEARLNIRIIEQAGKPVAYVEFRLWDSQSTGYYVREFGALPGESWRAAALFLVRELKREADLANLGREKEITNISFQFGTDHPLYDALGRQLEKQIEPYAWYMRVADMAAFLQLIAPALESRLAASVMAGYSGMLRLNLYRDRHALRWDEGKLVSVEPYAYSRLEEGDLRFPEHTFLHLLFGHRDYEEIRHLFPDSYASNAEFQVLAETLFPKRPSCISFLN
jgi:hypothetical protein